MPDAVALESSPSEILASMTPEQKKEWRINGKLPEVAPKESPKEEKTEAASSTAATTEVTEPPKADAAPVTAKEEHKPNKGAEARIKELLAQNKQLEAKLEEARRVPAPAKVEELARPHRNDVDPKTGQALFATDGDFEKAEERYLDSIVDKRVAKRQNEQRIAEQNRIIEQRWHNALKIANEKHADFAQVLDIGDEGEKKNVFRNKDLKAIKTNGVLDAWILDSEIGAELLYHLAKNPAEIERIQSLSAFAAARELTKLEAKLSGSESAPPPKEPEKSKAEGSSSHVTRAPAPASSVSGRATAPADEVEAAVKNEDFKSFRRAANAEDFKRKTS